MPIGSPLALTVHTMLFVLKLSVSTFEDIGSTNVAVEY